ncbi:MAG: nucleotide sugar dehydrogenase [Xanthobacteraceae bacterium]
MHQRSIAVIGLGYVGLPVAVAFTRTGHGVIGLDISPQRIRELKNGHDRTREVSDADLKLPGLRLTAEPAALQTADFFIVTVPTPINAEKRPDLRALLSASRMVGAALKPGDIVVYESTVYPGATENEAVPVLEQASGLRCGHDFAVGYSPERINPGDRSHRFETIQKVVAASDQRALDIVADVYGSVVTAGIYRAPNIRTAEAAKVIENTQRDLNIALMNELSAIFHKLDIDTQDVLNAAATKWNFMPFTPGLVGGHCIGVDPFYLTHRAEQVGHHPEIILAGRRINDGVGFRIARQCVRMLMAHKDRDNDIRGPVTVLGLSFKENVPDIRNTRVIDVIRELETFGVSVQVHDPVVDAGDAATEYGLMLQSAERLQPSSAVILAVAHKTFTDPGWDFIAGLLKNRRGVVLDIKAALPRDGCPPGIDLWRL